MSDPEAPEPTTQPTPAPRRPSRRERDSDRLPPWFRMTLLSAITVGLLYQLVVKGDVAVTLMLGGIVGTALGAYEVVTNLRPNGRSEGAE